MGYLGMGEIRVSRGFSAAKLVSAVKKPCLCGFTAPETLLNSEKWLLDLSQTPLYSSVASREGQNPVLLTPVLGSAPKSCLPLAKSFNN